MDSGGGGTPASAADFEQEEGSPIGSQMGYDDSGDGSGDEPSPSGRDAAAAANGNGTGTCGDAGAKAAARGLRELGGLAAWSVTSAKPGNGVELLRDGSAETFWQFRFCLVVWLCCFVWCCFAFRQRAH